MADFITLMDEYVVAETEKQIAKIRPILLAHKGDVEIINATPEELVLGLKGHCAGCPMAPITYGKVLNKFLRDAMPQLKEIKFIELK